MKSRTFLNDRVKLHAGDCMVVLPTLAENSVDSIVTDPPYHLASGKKGGSGPASVNPHSPAGRSMIGTGFMGKQWDGGDIAFDPATWAEVLRVLKPGGHLLAFAAPRNAHRMFCAIEDAGFEVRDCLQWIFGSGFPKSHDVSKGIDRMLGAERKVVGRRTDGPSSWMLAQKLDDRASGGTGIGFADGSGKEYDVTAPGSPEAAVWSGWGTALKPAYEPIVLARKPLSEGSIAANVLRWGTGAINIDACRIAKAADDRHEYGVNGDEGDPRRAVYGATGRIAYTPSSLGRWPANILHDGSEEVVGAFPESASTPYVENDPGDALHGGGIRRRSAGGFSDSGSAARFFYTAKADQDDRIGSKHPTVKPLDLMQYLVRLVTPPRGVVLDPFSGTGTTGEAAWREGFSAILIEREEEYQADIERRMRLALAGPDERSREAIKARTKDKPADHGPLFGQVVP